MRTAWVSPARVALVGLAGTLAACALITPRAAHAQTAATDISASLWLWRWSPLQPFSDLGLPAPRLPESSRLLDQPAPRVGLAWSNGNPAGLPDEIDSAWTQLTISTGGISGAYRRPLDPVSATRSGMSLAGWRRIGERVAAIGRVAVEREALSAGNTVAFVSPYGSSPFVPADTNRPAAGRPVVTIEGAEGMTIGAWRLGLAAGYRVLQNNSAHSAASLVGRASSLGVTVGAARPLGSTLRVGLQARRFESSESAYLWANPATIRVYALDGLVSVGAVDYSPAQLPFFRRADRNGIAVSADLSGRAIETKWTAYAGWQQMDERQVPAIAANFPADRWRTSGYAVGGAAQRAVLGMATSLRADWSSQSGDAVRVSTAGGTYGADASRLVVVADARYAPARSTWMGAATLSLGRDWQAVTDRAARMTTNIAALLPGVTAEVGRRVGESLEISVGYGFSRYTPYAAVPSPAGRGKAYTELIAPVLEIAAATARTDRGTVMARWHTGAGDVSLGTWVSNTRAVNRPAETVPLPRGARRAWGIAMSVEPRR